MLTVDVAIIGAGPYGLSAAAHLCTLKGLDVRVCGEPMAFWERNMPSGMLLRSNWTATHIAGPDSSLTLEAYQATSGDRFETPVPVDGFVRYGIWYQGQAVPHVDRENVLRVARDSMGFRIDLEDGETFRSRRVIVAVGIGAFSFRPEAFQTVPPALASHTSSYSNFAQFSGKEVLIIGSGQSALESAALLHESGAKVEVVAKAQRIHWLQGRLSKVLHHELGGFTRRLLYAPTDVGPAGLSQLMARPDLVRKLPRRLQDKLRRRCVRPAGARWLVDRLKDVPIRLGYSVVAAKSTGSRVMVRLTDGSERVADHILLGTGFRVDISKYGFLAPELLHAIERHNGYPALKHGLETSVSGLHIIGAPAAWSFGPLMQFVSGTRYASRQLMLAIGVRKSA